MAERRARPASADTPPATGHGQRRCAVYTRKSSEEGLEQAFNSLDAQREACEAYVRSQRHEGWSLLPARYDDGGISGGTLDRPALQQLLADVRAGRVNLIVVYKVDRLTRSLADFAKIVDVLDGHGASFVSVTQSFNTSTSMGRLTLNMLLSFAQFEREVTGERIRDKVAASKRKGMWMGGNVPLGYEVRDRKLVVVEGEAATVRDIYQRYLALGSVRLLAEDLAAAGVRSKLRPNASSPALRGGRVLGRGALYTLLRNRVYRGEVAHKGQVYPGEHAAIVEAALWDRVQQRLDTNGIEPRAGGRASSPSLLKDLLIDEAGERLTTTHANKRGVRYRYYVSQRLLTAPRAAHPQGWRLPAQELERLVTDALLQKLAYGPALLTLLLEAGLLPDSAPEQQRLLQGGAQLVRRWPELDVQEQRRLLRQLLCRVEVGAGQLVLQLAPEHLRRTLLAAGPEPSGSVPHLGDAARPGSVASVAFAVPATLQRAGREMVLLVAGPEAAPRANPALLRLLARAHALRQTLLDSADADLDAVARREGMSRSYVTRLVRLAYLAPRLVALILDGRQPAALTASRLMDDTRLPLGWAEQMQRFE